MGNGMQTYHTRTRWIIKTTAPLKFIDAHFTRTDRIRLDIVFTNIRN
jgi:hypothetical protein